MALRLITPPEVEPVSLEEAKSHLRVDHDDDDLLIANYIVGARQMAEKYTARAFVTQTWELVVDAFPTNEIMIPLPPLQSIVDINYDDAAGSLVSMSPLDFEVDTVSQPGWVVPLVSGWPSTWDGINAVRIRFTAGYSPTTDSPPDLVANIPTSLKNAILLQVGTLYASRESVVIGTIAGEILPGGMQHLLRQYRVALGMA